MFVNPRGDDRTNVSGAAKKAEGLLRRRAPVSGPAS